MQLEANFINIFEKKISFVQLTIEQQRIASIQEISPSPRAGQPYILPGFVDAHVHIESSMLTPVQFARLAVVHGTVATVSDPHEIANVLGVAGVEYMLENAAQSPFNFCFGAPSCVPATVFETAGATVTPDDIAYLFEQYPTVGYLAEVMNFPGVLNNDPDMLAKIALAKQYNKPIDGHAPGLRGVQAQQYIAAGCQTDHECFTIEEALDKLSFGMKILIREGSAAKNFEALIPLLPEHYANLMFCSDDKHPDNLVEGHINQLVKRALQQYPAHLFEVLQMACINPVLHYQLPVGLLREGDSADFILLDSLEQLNVTHTYLKGTLVAHDGTTLLPDLPSAVVNQFNCDYVPAERLALPVNFFEKKIAKVIVVLDGQLVTLSKSYELKQENGYFVADTERDLLKIVVVNRYKNAPPAIAFIQNFGLKQGAIASSVAHDSHNIVAVGCDDESLAEAINAVIKAKGGIAATDGKEQNKILPLPIAGLMSGENGQTIANNYAEIDIFAKQLGSTLQSPFMSLSFMALLVIPELKLSDLGLFDGKAFGLIDLIEKG